MKKYFAVILLFLLFCGLTSCNAISSIKPFNIFSEPTYTPYPTYTSFPTYTPVPRPTATPTTYYRSITWNELNDFLAGDHTNWNEYVPDVYNCVNFAMDLRASAKQKNIYAWLVSVTFEPEEPGHAFVAIRTSDKGVVWIEPQSDYAYAEVSVGKPLCLKVNTHDCGDFGIVTYVMNPADCDPVTHECWKKR